jgi:hypothetical protein
MEQGAAPGAVDGALRRLLVTERDFDAAADELAASRTQPAGSIEEHAVRTLESVHRLAMEIEAAARERAAEIERQARERADSVIAEGDAERERIREELRREVTAAKAQVTELLEIREELGLDLQAALQGSSEALRTLQRRQRNVPTATPVDRASTDPTAPGGGKTDPNSNQNTNNQNNNDQNNNNNQNHDDQNNNNDHHDDNKDNDTKSNDTKDESQDAKDNTPAPDTPTTGSTPDPDGSDDEGGGRPGSPGHGHGAGDNQGANPSSLSEKLAAVGNSQEGSGSSDGSHGPHDPGEEMPNPDAGGGSPSSNGAHGAHNFWDQAAGATQGVTSGLHLSGFAVSEHASQSQVAVNATATTAAHDSSAAQSETSAHAVTGGHDVAAHVELHSELGTATLHDQLTLSGGSFAHQMHV